MELCLVRVMRKGSNHNLMMMKMGRHLRMNLQRRKLKRKVKIASLKRKRRRMAELGNLWISHC